MCQTIRSFRIMMPFQAPPVATLEIKRNMSKALTTIDQPVRIVIQVLVIALLVIVVSLGGCGGGGSGDGDEGEETTSGPTDDGDNDEEPTSFAPADQHAFNNLVTGIRLQASPQHYIDFLSQNRFIYARDSQNTEGVTPIPKQFCTWEN